MVAQALTNRYNNMNIALIGYGKMGHAIERIAIARGHQIVLRITTANSDELNDGSIRQADVAIEFTRPESAKENVLRCLRNDVSVVCGTTGWNDELPEARAAAVDAAFLHASNFSIGVNIFFEVNKLLATLMNGHSEYEVTIEETHHTQKKDAPSGTAITLAEQAIARLENKKDWVLDAAGDAALLPISAHRVENVPGTHKITYSSPIDDIEITHTAHSRDGFALGAVMAAEFLYGKKGVCEMKDVLGIK